MTTESLTFAHSGYELLTSDEEIVLAKRIERGKEAKAKLGGANGNFRPEKREELKSLVADGAKAFEHFAGANKGLVISIAIRFEGQGLETDDLVQEGTGGLLRAIHKFDWRRKKRFSTMATYWIWQACQRAVANKGRVVRIPVHEGDRISRMLKVQDRLQQELGREPSTEELASRLGTSVKNVESLVLHSQNIISLDENVHKDEGLSPIIELEPDRSVEGDPEQFVFEKQRREALREALNSLTPRQAEMLRRYYGFDRGKEVFEEIGRRMGITREAARQNVDAARKKLRALRFRNLRDYFEE